MMEKVGINTSDKNSGQQNEYEQQRLKRIQDNKYRMQSLGIKRISASLTSLVESKKENKKMKKSKNVTKIDKDYVPNFDDEDDMNFLDDNEYEKEDDIAMPKKDKRSATKGKLKKSQFIPPMCVAKFFNMNKKQQVAMVGDKTFKSLSKAMKVVEQAISNNHVQSNAHQKNIGQDEDIQDIEGIVEDLNENADNEVEMNKDMNEHLFDDDVQMNQEDMEIHNDEDFQVTGDVSTHVVDDELNGDRRLIVVEGPVKRRRGPVYCRKLTILPPGEKIYVEFNKDGIPVGKNSSLFAFFLGEQVRNSAVIPLQVKDWEDIQPDKKEHLWSCVLEKCSFDDPEIRKDSVLKHARKLYRDSRHKLKRKYYDDPNLKTKAERLKNKPEKLLKADWKYLVEFWSDEKFQSMKAAESRSHQKMPHYNGTKSFARTKDEFKEKHGKECSRVELLIETRKRKSKKSVIDVALAYNMHALSEMKKLKEEREQGLNNFTDEQIFVKVLGEDTHGYLRAYGGGKSITDYFGVKPSRINLAHEMIEVKKNAEQAVQEARKDSEDARKEAENARKDAELARKEAEATRDEVNQKIAANNKLWEKRLKKILQGCGINASKSDDSESTSSSSSIKQVR
ncbi:uncharacterized protein LOC110683767 isoform X2 [Chenopodium quinoa]|uniref:uncharacterized protein LOC110683767 isoform X2 n=1 Tax=Chenopodium quinoa TaxID=63459 RepID=UPI000B798EBB|nr:uncharacterized protein LOC110683767 isoform X2 [Chenopodium quinoa]